MKSSKQWLFIALVTGIIAQAIFVSVRGVVFGADSPDYLSCWEDVRRSGYLPFLLSNRINKYFYYCFLGGTLGKLFGATDAAIPLVIGFQVLAAGSIPFLLFLALRRFSVAAGLSAAALTLIVPDLYRWSPYVLTDTFFITAQAVMLFAVSRLQLSASTLRITLVASAITLASLTRVSGLVFPLFLGFSAFLLYAVLSWTRSTFSVSQPALRTFILAKLRFIRQSSVLLLGYGLTIVLFFSIIASSGGGFFSNKGVDFFENIKKGLIFYGLDSAPQFPVRTSSGSLQASLDVIKVLLIRALYYFLPTYSWHSIRHQVVNATIFSPLYALAVYGIYRVIKYRQENVYCLAGMACAQILYHLLVSVYVNVEPDHRTLAPSFPGLIILASLGVATLLPPVSRRETGRALS